MLNSVEYSACPHLYLLHDSFKRERQHFKNIIEFCHSASALVLA